MRDNDLQSYAAPKSKRKPDAEMGCRESDDRVIRQKLMTLNNKSSRGRGR